ncbi:DMT family transporter [Thiocystis violacea]|uniref:DMT family transporter n=1 Tax=Thiocystis violacea TaxID=13725 RepID=UPI001907CEBE|nr:DMT family transporter [Thiocystis violacea]MBK1724569.1 EamA family transporter [Thiocystis violacea]
MTRRTPDTAFLMVLLANVGFAFKGVFAKLALATGMTLAGVLMLRIAMALPLYWIAVRLLAHKGTRASRMDWRDGLLIGTLFTLATVADFMAIDRLGAGLSRMLLFTYPLLVQALTAWRERRLPTGRELTVFAVCYAGLALLFAPKGFAGHLETREWIGIACGFVAAASYALFLVLGQGIAARLGSARFTAIMNTSTFLVFLLYALTGASPQDFQIPAIGLGWIAIMVVAATVLPFLLLFEGIRRTGAGKASLVALSGPGVTLIAAWIFLGERILPIQTLGFLLILGGMACLQFGNSLQIDWTAKRQRIGATLRGLAGQHLTPRLP